MLALNADGKVVSNAVKFHYVLEGASATIENVTWDKESYQKGETAVVSFTSAPSADIFLGSRAKGTALVSPTVELTMTDENGTACSAPVTHAVGDEKTPLVSLQFLTTAACVHPQISATIKDTTHGVLATGHFQTVAPVAAPAAPVSSSGESSGSMGLIIALVVLIIAVVIFFVAKQKGKGAGTPPAAGMLLLVLMIAGGLFTGAPRAHADTWNDGGNAIYTGNIDKGWGGSYAVGETVHVTGSVERFNCGNAVYAELVTNLDGATMKGISGKTVDVTDLNYGPGVGASTILFLGDVPVTPTATANAYFTAPNPAPADHHVSFIGMGYEWSAAQYGFHDILFYTTVPPPPPPAPVVTLTQSPGASVTSGTEGYITWSASNNPTSCSVYNNGTQIASGAPASATNYDIGPLTVNPTTLKVTCTNAGGSGSASVSFTVTIVPPQLSVSPLGDYGVVVVNETKDKTITITNTGGSGSTLNVTGIADISGSPHFACISGCTGALASNASQNAVIRLTAPATPGALPNETNSGHLCKCRHEGCRRLGNNHSRHHNQPRPT